MRGSDHQGPSGCPFFQHRDHCLYPLLVEMALRLIEQEKSPRAAQREPHCEELELSGGELMGEAPCQLRDREALQEPVGGLFSRIRRRRPRRLPP
ncbi:hypothetical protein GCM10009618_05420 [Nesterenkonia lacusekhoensis]